MTKQQWALLGILGIGVLCLYCVGGWLALEMLSAPRASPDSSTFSTPPTALALITPTSPTPSATFTPTREPTAQATATWVIAPPPAQPGATVVGTRAPNTTPGANVIGTRAPNTTPGATATRRATIPPVGPVLTSWSKAQNVTAYRIEFDWTVKGNLPDIPANWQTAQGIPLFGIAGAVSGKDSQMKFKGLLAVILTGDPTKSIEILTVGGKTYLRGPAPMFGAPEDKWYAATGQFEFSTKVNEGMPGPPSDPAIDWNAFKKTGTEILDGRRCDVYSGDKNTTIKLFQSASTETSGASWLDNIENATTKFWICDDGYLHQWIMNIDGRAKDKPTEKISLQSRLRMWDFNANIKLTPPANPAPLQMPSFDFSLATPTKTR